MTISHVMHRVQDIFKYIARHRPAPLEQLPMRLMPFIPEYIPAVGGTDEFIKVPRPDGQPDYLGLKVRRLTAASCTGHRVPGGPKHLLVPHEQHARSLTRGQWCYQTVW